MHMTPMMSTNKIVMQLSNCDKKSTYGAYYQSTKQDPKYILTLKILYCFKEYKICIHISYQILDIIQPKKTKFIILCPVAISAIFCPAESPGDAGGMSYTAARGILLQLTRSPAVPRAFCLIRVASGCHMQEISVNRRTIPRRGAKKIGPRAIPVIRVAESPGGADPRRVNCNTWLKIK